MAGVTNAGFVPKRFNEIIEGLRENAKPIFQDLVKPGEEVDVGDTSTIGRLIGLIALDLDQLWQAAQEVYQAFDPNSATGVALDNIVQYLGLVRMQGTSTVLRASVWGTTNTYLPQGQVVRGESSYQFRSSTEMIFSPGDIIGGGILPTLPAPGQPVGFTFITSEGVFSVSHTMVSGESINDILNSWLVKFNALNVIGVKGYISAGKFYVEVEDYFAFITIPSTTSSLLAELKKRLTFNSVDFGDIAAPIGTVTNILTPVFGWLSVINEISAEAGSLYETDEELRERFRVSKAVRANNTSEALYSQLLELQDVRYARIYENMTNAVDTKGLPPHSFMAIVRGGTSTDIGGVVWRNEPLGIASHGTETVVIRDTQNIEREVKFSRAIDVPVYVNVQVKKTDNTFPDNGVELIRNAVVSFLNDRATFGEAVIYTRMFTPINSVPGHQIDLLEIGTSPGSLAQSNIPMTWQQFPVSLPEYVTVTLTT